jgi:hypothetical protein
MEQQVRSIKTFESTKTKPLGVRKSRVILRSVGALDGGNETGVAVTSYGQGQVTGAIFTRARRN